MRMHDLLVTLQTKVRLEYLISFLNDIGWFPHVPSCQELLTDPGAVHDI